MDSASTAISNFLQVLSPDNDEKSAKLNEDSKKAGDKDTTVDETVAPAVEHETVVKEHEQREQKVVEKERHQDHYHTTVQPLKDREVLPTEHKHEEAKTQYREVDHDEENKAKLEADDQNAGFTNETKEVDGAEKTTKEATISGEHVHHHLHETIQPVIEKETIQPTVTHKTIPIKEKHQEVSQNHGVTREEPMSVDDFTKRLDGESREQKSSYDGAPKVDE